MCVASTIIKLRLQPEENDANTLDGQSRICNWLYNDLLDKALELKSRFIETKDLKSAQTVYSKRGLRDLVPTIKESHPFLSVVHSSVLKNTALRLSQSIQTFQKSKKIQKKVGWPKFRSWKRNWFSLFYDEPTKGFKIGHNKITLSLGMGKDKQRRCIEIPMPNSSLLKGKTVRNLRIVCQLGVYYAVFTIQKQLPEKKPIQRILALDPNHKNLAYGVCDKGKAFEIKVPSFLKIYDKRMDELKKKRDRCLRKSKKIEMLDENQKPIGKYFYKASKSYRKYDLTLKACLQKRREQTKTFMYTTAQSLVKEYDVIGIGDYTPDGGGITKKMRRAMNNRSLIGRFKETLSWVCEKSGKTYIEYPEKGTTRTCSHCTYINPEGLKPSIRVWDCPSCAIKHIRDENAAQNGLKIIIEMINSKQPSLQVSCSDLFPVMERWAWCVIPSGVKKALRGKSSDIYCSTRKLNQEYDNSWPKVIH